VSPTPLWNSTCVIDASEPENASGLSAQRGLSRLRAIFALWLDRTAVDAASACIWISGASEYDDRPGPVRDELVRMVLSWQRELMRAIQQAIETGELLADADPGDLVFDLYGVILILHHDARLMARADSVTRARRAFDRLIAAYLAAPAVASRSASTQRASPLPH
jgi:hypothetical protein